MIKSLKISNFKSISDEQTVNLRQFTAIVGSNGVGKSNFINAISLVKDLARGSNIAQATHKFVLTSSELFNRNTNSTDSRITLNLKNGSEQNYSYTIIIGLDKKSEDIPKLIIKYEKLELCLENKCDLVYERNEDNLYNNEGAKIPLDLPSNIAALSQYKNTDLQKIKNLLHRTFVSSLEVTDLIPKVERHIFDLTKQPKKYEQFMKLASDFLPSLKTFEKIEVASDDPFAEKDEYFMLLTEKGMKGRLSLKAISHGDLRTLYLLATGILSDDFSTFVFDEIENGIHPQRIDKLIDFLSNISVSSNKQFVFSTHSTKIINSMRPQDVIYVCKDPEKGTIFKELNTAQEIDSASKVLDKGGELYEYLQARF